MLQQEKHHQFSNGQRKGKVFDNSIPASESEQGSSTAGGRWKKMFLWCAKCCKKQRRKRTDPGKSRLRFLDCRKKKKGKSEGGTSISSGRSSTSTIQRRVSIGETTKRTTDKKGAKAEEFDGEPRKSKRSKSKTSKRKDRRDTSETSRSSEKADDERLTNDDVPEKDFPDFKKSCCYLCAKHTLAIAAAAANKVEKSDMVIQVSAHQFFRDTSTSNKNFIPALHVRTVQSSVKVRTRETSTTQPEVTKTKRTKPKSKLKKFSIFPKAKRTKCPGVRTVACETDKSTKYNRVMCGGRHEQYCRRNN